MRADADLAFREPSLGAGLLAQGTCTGRVPGRPLPVLTRHLRFGLRAVQAVEETPVTVGGQVGVRSRFIATLDGVPVAVDAVTLRGTRCVYDLVVVTPPDQLALVGEDFGRFLASFALSGEGLAGRP